jgi:hypothetical protein
MSDQVGPGVFKPLNRCLSLRSLSLQATVAGDLSLQYTCSDEWWLLGQVRLHPRVLLHGNLLPCLYRAFVALQAFKVKISFFYLISQCTKF